MPAARQSTTQKQRPTETLHESRDDILYEEGTNLPFIEARTGFVQRWVRSKLDNHDDDKNIYKRQRQGWEPRKYTTVPKGQRVPKTQLDDIDIIGMHNMILMERSEEQHERYKNMRRNDVRLQQQAIDNDVMKFHDAETGQRQSGVTSEVHTGNRQPNVADD